MSTTENLLKEAMFLQRRGETEQAKQVCEDILKDQPDHITTLNLLARLYHQQGHLDKSMSCIEKALTLQPEQASTRIQQAYLQYLTGDKEEAQKNFNDILKKNTNQPMVLNQLGGVLHQLKAPKKAAECLQQAIRQDPTFVPPYIKLVQILNEREQYEDATKILAQGIKNNPEKPGLYFQLGNTLNASKKYEKAAQSYQKTLSLNPEHNMARIQLSKVLSSMRRFIVAEQVLAPVLEKNNKSVPAHIQMATVLRAQNKYEQELEHCQKVVVLQPKQPQNFANLGISYQDNRQWAAAEAQYKKAIEIAPKHPNAHFSWGNLLLMHGQYEQGWKEYEWRWQLPQLTKLKKIRDSFKKPQWDGESSLKDKRLFVWREQGFGDYLFMCRYLPHLKQLGATIILQCQPSLVDLSKTFPEADEVVAFGEEYDDFDLHCPIMSLPYTLKIHKETDIPNKVPYVTLPKDEDKQTKWSKLIPASNKIKVGIVWGGSLTNGENYKRSIPLTLFSELFKTENTEFYSLQLGEPYQKVLAELNASNVTDLANALKDFTDTAFAVSQLDLIICVDTAIGHLAGAMDVPVWTLHRYNGDWRWLLDRSDTPWYPSMTLFRQKEAGNWNTVIEEVSEALNAFKTAGS